MPQQQRVQWAQLRVGVMAILAMTVLAVSIFFISGQVGFFTPHYTLRAYFPGAGDLREGAQVRLAGITVGSVAKIQISPFSDPARAVELDMKIVRTFQDKIRVDSIASIETVGLLGDSYIDITRGTSGQEALPDGGSVKTLPKADITAVVQNTNDVIMNLTTLSAKLDNISTQIQAGKGSIGKLIYDQTLYNKMDATITAAQALVDRASNGEGTMGKLMADDTLYNRTVSTIDRLNQIMDDVQHGNGSLAKFISDPSAYNNLNRLMTSGNSLIDGINQGHGSLGKLVKDEEIYNRLNSTLGHMDTIAARIDQGQGTLGKLSTDTSLFTSLNDSAQSLKEFLTDLRKDPKKYLTVKMHLF